jgi:hypothetical protein
MRIFVQVPKSTITELYPYVLVEWKWLKCVSSEQQEHIRMTDHKPTGRTKKEIGITDVNTMKNH